MTQDDIIRMARDAGLEQIGFSTEDWVAWTSDLERFAALVAAAEREACAKVCGELADNPENSEQYRMGANWARERIRARGETK